MASYQARKQRRPTPKAVADVEAIVLKKAGTAHTLPQLQQALAKTAMSPADRRLVQVAVFRLLNRGELRLSGSDRKLSAAS